MVQISTSTVVVAILATTALAAPAPYDADDLSLSRREPEPLGPKLSGVRSAISNKVNKLKGAVSGLRKDERKEKNRLANDIRTGNFKDAAKAEGRISRDKAGIRKDKAKEGILETAAADLGRRDIEDFESELVRRDPPVTPKTTPKPKKTAAQRKAGRKGRLNAAIKKEEGVLRGEARKDKQALRGERQKLDQDIASGNFGALQKDEQAITKTKGDLQKVRKNEATLSQIEKNENLYTREFDDEFELEAREFDDFEEELVRRDPPVTPKTTPKTTPKPKKTAAQRKAGRKGRLNAAIKKEEGVLRGEAKKDRQALRGERQKLDQDIASGNFGALQKDEQAITKTKGDLQKVKKNEATLSQIEKNENLYTREFDDEFELEARDFDDEYELEARDFDDLEERGFDDYELEMLD